MVEFRVKHIKTVHALHYLMGVANGRGSLPSQYDLVKSVFLADRAHLNRFGRPITFDRYVAMKHGPVPSFAYECLKPTFDWGSVFLDGPPWTYQTEGNIRRFQAVGAAPHAKKLSKTDMQHLSDALATVLSLTFGQIRRLTHEDPAYIDAWREDAAVQAFPMKMELLLDDPDEGAVEDLRYLSEMSA